MTLLARFLERRMIDVPRMARRAGIGKERIRQLMQSNNFDPCINEVKLIALAIHVPPAELFEYLCKDIRTPATLLGDPFD